MLKKSVVIISIGLLFSCGSSGGVGNQVEQPAATPPMGWNSWICFGTSVTEDEVKANADYMAEHLKQYGWEYIIIDAGWYAPGMVGLEEYEAEHPYQLIDGYGRLRVDEEKYPSAVGGYGLKKLADYIHSKGLKLGIHIMRGIPVQAVEENTPIKGTQYHASDIADRNSRCEWYRGLYGVDMSKPGAQAYYDSLFELYASWGVDYVKADDLLSPVYAADEIEAIAEALDKCGRKMVLSLSPGPAPIENVRHMSKSSQLWRISEDFWDNWESLKSQFDLCRKWQSHIIPGHWPDADMLPIGPMALRAMRGKARSSHFTRDEQYTLMSLWAMFRSPLMLGCNLPEMDDFTLNLVTNAELIRINQASTGNRELFAKDGIVAWYAMDEETDNHYVAVFNTTDEMLENYSFDLTDMGIICNTANVMDIWTGAVGTTDGNLVSEIRPHGVKVLKINCLNK